MPVVSPLGDPVASRRARGTLPVAKQISELGARLYCLKIGHKREIRGENRLLSGRVISAVLSVARLAGECARPIASEFLQGGARTEADAFFKGAELAQPTRSRMAGDLPSPAGSGGTRELGAT